jgi:DNA-binding protein H-NS
LIETTHNQKDSAMSNIDLAGYTLGELKGLQHDIERMIKERQQQEVQKAREQILAIAKQVGVSIEELLGNAEEKAKTRSAQKVQPKYQNPKDASQTWTGRGRQPRWIAKELETGKKIVDFLMN